MIVVDASAALSALLNAGPARHVLAEEQLHCPHLVDSEVTSGLRRMVASGNLTAEDGWTALDRWRRLGITRYPMVGVLHRVWELRDNLSAYDASYVALAEMLELSTADSRRPPEPRPGYPMRRHRGTPLAILRTMTGQGLATTEPTVSLRWLPRWLPRRPIRADLSVKVALFALTRNEKVIGSIPIGGSSFRRKTPLRTLLWHPAACPVRAPTRERSMLVNECSKPPCAHPLHAPSHAS